MIAELGDGLAAGGLISAVYAVAEAIKWKFNQRNGGGAPNAATIERHAQWRTEMQNMAERQIRISEEQLTISRGQGEVLRDIHKAVVE